MKAWQRQTKDFGHDRADKYTCLIHDNRGNTFFALEYISMFMEVPHAVDKINGRAQQ